MPIVSGDLSPVVASGGVGRTVVCDDDALPSIDDVDDVSLEESRRVVARCLLGVRRGYGGMG